MGKFLQESIQIDQVNAGIFKTLNDLTYITNAGSKITVPKGYVTDGYSKPQLTEWLVGGRFEDDIRPSTLHDYLCQYRGFYQGVIYNPLSFKKVNDLFLEAMLAVGINPVKARLMRFAVNFNPGKW